MTTIRKGYDTIQRNEPCPCESGLKYKKCCLLVLQNRQQKVYENIHAQRRLQDDTNTIDNTDIDRPRLILSGQLQDKESRIIIP